MSFPGYLRSLNLVNKHDEEYQDSQNRNDIQDPTATETQASETSKPKQKADIEKVTLVEHPEDCIVDEKGNGPTKSLWVGNIPPRTASSELRALFGRFGPIVSTKPQAKYAFVNFEKLEHAIDAWRKYHDQDIFGTGYSTINIRFASSLAEAKQAKVEQERKTSTTLRVDAIRKQWFHPTEPKGDSTSTDPRRNVQWPNGKPPTGPKSQRPEISPPPLSRGDSYRPSELNRVERRSSHVNQRRTSDDEHGRFRGRRSPSEDCYSPASHCWDSDSCKDNESSDPIKRIVQEIVAGSPPVDKCTAPDNKSHSRESQRDLEQIIPNTILELVNEIVPRSATLSGLNHDSKPQSLLPAATQIKHRDNVGNDQETSNSKPWQHGLIDIDRTLALANSYTIALESALETMHENQSHSPLVRPIGRLRFGNGTIRGSSVVSEDATTSSRTSTRRKRCHDCKRPASMVSPLIACSKCTRQYHSGCGCPRPSSFDDKTKFVCAKCLRRNNDLMPLKITTSNLGTGSCAAFVEKETIQQIQLISPPLSLSHGAIGSINLSPQDVTLSATSDDGVLENVTNETSCAMTEVAPIPTEGLKDEQDDSLTTYTNGVRKPLRNSRSRTQTLVTDHEVLKTALEKKKRYKFVTCKWWALGNCTQSEDGCYYAHRHTGIMLPDRKRVNKHWTCYEWLHSSCVTDELNCLYAHADTGLYVWRDGRPSFKHVTCFWWSRGGCKWDTQSCKFAHEDTGLYSLDPADIWQGGSKFTTSPYLEHSTSQDKHNENLGSFTSSERTLSSPTVPQQLQHLTSSDAVGIDQSSATTSTRPHMTTDTSITDIVDPKIHSRLSAENVSQTLDAPASVSLEHDVEDYAPATSESYESTKQLQSLSLPPYQQAGECSGYSLDGSIESARSMKADEVSLNPSYAASTSFIQEAPRDVLSPSLLDDSEGAQNLAQKANRCDSPDYQSIDIPRDPRLQFAEKLFAESDLASQRYEMAVPIENNIKDSLGTRSSAMEETSRRGVNKCQKCYRPVFGSTVCRTCSSSSTKTSPTQRIPHKEEQSPNLPLNPTIGQEALDTVTEKLPPIEMTTKLQHQPAQVVRPALKRSSADSSIFLKNKRPRLSIGSRPMVGSRLDSTNFGTNDKGVQTKHNSPTKRAVRPTLEDLIVLERLKNNKERKESVLNGPITQSPTSHNQTDQSTFEKLPHVASIGLSRATDADRNLRTTGPSKSPGSLDLPAQKVVEAPVASEKGDSRSCDLLPTPSSLLAEGLITPSFRSFREDSNAKGTLPPRIGASPPKIPEGRAIPPNADQPKTLNKSSPYFLESRRLSKDDQRESEQCGRNGNAVDKQHTIGSTYRSSSNNTNNTSRKLTWASAVTCTKCQKHHKKCLHDVSGGLSAAKCREYVLSRKGKPDTSRSRQEWSAIVDASELGSESDSADLDSDHDEVAVSSATSDFNEDDYTTASDGERDVEELTSHPRKTEGEILLHKFQKSPPRVNLPPRRPSIYNENRQISDSTNCWATPAEIQKKEYLIKKGVMFETESASEDYDESDNEAPCRFEQPADPLYRPPIASKHLFEVAPELELHNQAVELFPRAQPPSRPGRKQQWAELKSRQLQERRERFGNPHWEVKRKHDDITVTAVVERIVPPKNVEDRLAVGSVQIREEQLSFADFLGAPKMPELCLMNDGERLAFQDGQREREKIFGRTGRGLGRPATDEEKWHIRPK